MKLRVRHLVIKPGRNGAARHYWQPSALLRKAGWQPVNLGPNLDVAIRQAQGWNERVALWREGSPGVGPAGKAAVKRQQAKYARKETLRELIQAFRQDRWDHLAPNTRKQYAHALTMIDTWAGDQPVGYITADRCRVLLQLLAKPAARNQPERLHRAAGVGRVLRTLLGWAVDHERATVNPMDRVTIREPKARHHLWPDHCIDAMVAMADARGLPSIGDAILLAADTGQRESDLLAFRRMPRRADGRRWMRLQQGKTGVWIDIPFTARLDARIDQAEARHAKRKIASVRLLVRETDGQPWPQEAFIRAVAEVRTAAIAGSQQHQLEPCPEMAGLQFRDLRRTIIVRLAEAGVDLPGIAAISGHKIELCKKILETYLPRTSKMAAAAIEKLEAYRAKQQGQAPDKAEGTGA